MKNILTLTGIFFCVFSYSQKVGISISGGLVKTQQPMTRIYFLDKYVEENRNCFSPKLNSSFKIIQNLYINPTLCYNYFRSREYYETDNYGVTNGDMMRFGNHSILFDIPAQLNIRFANEKNQYPYIKFGFSCHYYIKETVVTESYYEEYSYRNNSLHYGIIAGFGINISKRLFTEAEYIKTMNKKVDSDFRYAQITIGYYFLNFCSTKS